MYTCWESRAKAYARWQLRWRRRDAASASRSPRAPALPSRGPLLNAPSPPAASPLVDGRSVWPPATGPRSARAHADVAARRADRVPDPRSNPDRLPRPGLRLGQQAVDLHELHGQDADDRGLVGANRPAAQSD